MTSKQIYEATAIELSKVQAPALKLYEFNYFFNQAIRQFVNKVYNVYDINQQTTDDLRVLKATATLKPELATTTGNAAIDYLRGATYYVDMPDDYLHLLNCICLYDVNKQKDCWDEGDIMVVSATKLTADSWSNVIDDVYNQPTKKHPYYYIHNQNIINVDNNIISSNNNNLPTNNDTDQLHTLKGLSSDLWNSVLDAARTAKNTANSTKITVITAAITAAGTNTDITSILNNITADSTITTPEQVVADLESRNPVLATSGTSNFNRTFNYDSETKSTVEKPAGSRYANSSRVKIEIRCGRDKSNIFSLSAVQIDYVKAPQFIRLTQEQLDSDEDISQIMEFPDYVNQEIVNELVNLVMRKINDPSLSAHIQMTQSIARPTGQSQQQPATQG